MSLVHKLFVKGHSGLTLKITDRRLHLVDRQDHFQYKGILFTDLDDDLLRNLFQQGGRLVHPFFDDPKKVDIVDDAVQTVKGPVGFIVKYIQVDLEGVAGRQFFLEDAVTAGEDEIMELNGDHS